MAIPLIIGGAVAVAASLWAKNTMDSEQKSREQAERDYRRQVERERNEKEKKARIALALESYQHSMSSVKNTITAQTTQLLTDHHINDGFDTLKSVTNKLVKFVKKDFVEMQTFPEQVIDLAFSDTAAAIEKIQQQYEKSNAFKERKTAVTDLQNKLEQLKQLEKQLKG